VEQYLSTISAAIVARDWGAVPSADPVRLLPAQTTIRESVLPSRFFVRSSYHQLLRHLVEGRTVYMNQDMDPPRLSRDYFHGARVLGTPGIGKTTGTVYWIVELLRRLTPPREPNFKIVWTLDLQKERYLIQHVDGIIRADVAKGDHFRSAFQDAINDFRNVHFQDTYVTAYLVVCCHRGF